MTDKKEHDKEPEPGFWADGIHYDANGYDKNGVHYYTHNSASRGRRYS
ncbi:MAG TPA: hypothetical protein VIY48_02635 [Candidatus Paceibacterota bacterium]